MEIPRFKRRKSESIEVAAHDDAVRKANICDTTVDQSMECLSSSKPLFALKYDTCFGMIKIEAKSLRSEPLEADGENFVEVSLSIEGDQLIARNIVTHAYGGLFARQHRSTLALRELYEHHGATLRAWLIRGDASTRKKHVYNLFVVIYGMYGQRDAIGDALDCAELFLQDPPDQMTGDQSVPYFNPHRLYNPALGNGMKQPDESDAIIPARVEKQQKILYDTDPLKRRLQEVMDSACALSMMVEKENGDIDENAFDSVWKVMRQHDSIKYKNTVTGSVQTNFPRLCHGGILADEMGLGKTLTIISLIAASKDWTEFGADRSSSPETTLVVTALSLSNEMPNKAQETIAGRGIASIEWLRVILDEAHEIRNRSTRRFRATCALKARFRWCLTGTPIFNRVEDLGSLIGFLGVHPFDSSSIFNSQITNPVVKGTPNGLETLRKLVHATSLRRNKDSIRDELRLPGRRIVKEFVQLSREEQRDYDLLKSRYASILDEDDGTNIARRYTASVMQTIARLRQFCDHGLDLLPKKKKIPEQETMVDIVCNLCDLDTTRSGSNSPHQETNYAVAKSDYMPSSKVQALLRNLVSVGQTSPTQPIKSVVFSCWIKMLDLIQRALVSQGLDFVRIDGSKTERARREAISRFRSDHDCGILLATIGSAGVGLDLTVASHVHIVEPQWTQTAENQAIDRVHRLGQTQEVIATRYIYVLTVQDKKSAVMREAFDTDGVESVISTRERFLQV
ncbi:hypothetical protein J7T55_004495 [Diaporthe amygdali]|uniref:uncharacterized protein n=1 Tax=Phomopsis amygdali TaxID=1214568 RepID=UPI0022FE9BD8|nr:uncharacterized protein J7T55_004495 [Diaporthe amygdali]KAJ0114754.1 hypothetical protein J7T55_004495 [Diaporthe amygdali]